MKRISRRTWKRVIIVCCAMIALFISLDLLFPVHTEVEYAPVIRDRNGAVLHTFLTADEQWRFNTSLDEITPELSKAIIFKEDRHFYRHFGINPLSVCRAAVNNIFRLKRTSGASTITMQVARMLQPKKRTYLNKIVEMFRALQLEVHYSKKEILQLYLNLVPYGSNIQGVKAASILYFDKSPDQLSLAELTALSIIPNRPNSLVPGRDNLYIEQQRNKWLKRFGEAKLFPKEIIADALREPLLAYRRAAPKNAPQLSYRMRRQYPGLAEIITTIDQKKQVQAEEITGNYMNSLKLQGIHNAAVLIIDNKTHEVVSYIGSSDYCDRFHSGQVDGVVALRSPGSTLKPLLYGLCMDRGLITSKTMIADVPVNFKGYIPENYDLSFHGNITAEEALQKSLNIPAVKLLNELQVKNFMSALGQSGFQSLWDHRHKMGLSMILGGCSARLEELTALYACFAANGAYHPLVYRKPDTMAKIIASYTSDSLRLLSPAAAYMINRILTDLHRPDLPNLNDQARNIPRIAWKTGTSYGRRDAWSIGYNDRYTIGVWIGNFSGKGVASLNGAVTATPLLFQLFNALDRGSEEWLTAPEEVAFRLVCSVTGKVPDSYCTSQVMDFYIPGVSSNIKCDHVKTAWVTPDEHFSFCTSCVPESGYKTREYPNIAAELAAYYDKEHIAYEHVPPHNPSCTRLFEGTAPTINSLTDNMTYIIADKGRQQLQLACMAANDVQKVYWYINDRFFATAGAGEKIFFDPGTTDIKISCTDDKGRISNIRIKVRFI